jgi:hypothetical protein
MSSGVLVAGVEVDEGLKQGFALARVAIGKSVLFLY